MASRRCFPSSGRPCPRSLKLDTVNDQSSFVYAAVNSVIFEGVVAAALTGLMILIFLGSWRSTLIITISIPLAILASVTLLAATGETINVMTLGGLALAVGILVDDATVTIENINYHLEQGKDIESAIMDGARQIVLPATVSLLCICIVFVPMFNLGGVAGYLFRPMAEGRRLRAYRFVCPLAHPGEHDGALPARPSGDAWPWRAAGADPQSLHSFPARIRAALRGGAGPLSARAGNGLGGTAALYQRLPVGGGAARSRSRRSWARISFRQPPILSSSFMFARRRGPALKARRRSAPGSKKPSGEIIPPEALGPIVDNIGLPVSGINSTYNNTGTVGPADADILITINKEYESETDGYVKAMREALPRSYPGTTFAFLPADIVSQILNFGLPAPIDVQVVGATSTPTTSMPMNCCKKSRGFRESRTRVSSRRSTIRRSASTSTGCARRKSA